MIDTSVLLLLVTVFMTPFLLCLIDKVWGTHLSCKYFSWHDGKDKVDSHFDGCSVHATCSKCEKDVMQDSQGNWF